MQDRPQHAVGEAVVILLEVAARDVGGDVGDAGMLEFANLFLALRHGTAAPAEPDAFVTLEERAQHDLKAAGPRRAIAVRTRHAI